MDKMTSNEIKTALYHHYRFVKQCHYMCDEVSTFYSKSDFLIVDNKNKITEIEIKISISDLKNDFKKCIHDLVKRNKAMYLVNRHYFYFCIPIDLLEKAKEIIINENDKYGILYAGGYNGQFLYSYHVIYQDKKAKLLQDNIATKDIDRIKHDIVARMSSKIANDMVNKYRIKDQREIDNDNELKHIYMQSLT